MKQAQSLAAALFAAATLSFTVTGCGTNAGTSTDGIQLAPLSGIAHGGPNPISGATVNLYETQTAASGATYGSAAKLLATATTNAYGGFTFPNVTSPYTCDAGQFAYVVVSGGNTGGLATNPNPSYILMAALGACSNLSSIAAQTATRIFVSEATTVAAAYALSNFTTVTGTTVNVNAPASNNGATGSCTITSTSSTCTASGLSEAFANAVALASGVVYGGAINGSPTGLFNTSMPGYPGSVIPVQMLNTLASALQACVNSTGGTAGDGSACGTLFNDTTPNSSANPPFNLVTAAPTDTLTALITLAKSPYLTAANGPTVAIGPNAANPNTTGLFSLVTATSYFQPTLAAAPTDYSLGVFYPGSTLTGGTTPAAFPYSIALDASGTVYVLSADGGAATTTTTSGITTVATPSAATRSGLTAISYGANGPALLYSNANNVSASFAAPGTLGVDNLGNVFASNVAAPTTIREFTAVTGAVSGTTPVISPTLGANPINSGRSLTVDRSNNLWMTTDTTSSAIYQVPLTGAVTQYSASTTAAETSLSGVIVDANQNIWSCSVGTSNTANRAFAIPANPGAAQPAVLGAPGRATNSPDARKPGGFLAQPTVDAVGNVYCPTNGGVSQDVPNNPLTAILSSGEGFLSTTGALYGTTSSQIDGNNVYVAAANLVAGRLWLLPISGVATSNTAPFITNLAPAGLDPCYPIAANGGGVYCSSNPTAFPTGGTPAAYSILAYDTSMQIDSAGTAWNVSGNSVAATSPTGIVQIIGTAAPTVPQLSAAKFGAKP